MRTVTTSAASEAEEESAPEPVEAVTLARRDVENWAAEVLDIAQLVRLSKNDVLRQLLKESPTAAGDLQRLLDAIVQRCAHVIVNMESMGIDTRATQAPPLGTPQ